jgi:SAM-dependent methyltransferase
MSDKQIFARSKQVWEENIKKFPETKLNYPDENLVRLFSGRYIPVPQPPAKVMDHGFGTANTLVFLADKGYECAGCELSEQFIADAAQLFKKKSKYVDLRLVTGLEVPFETDSFDVVVSWNVVHYNGTREAVQKIVNELHRVLKPSGVLLLSTINPGNALMARMKPLGKGSYLIEKESRYDNRWGLTFYVAQTAEELASLFSKFSDVKMGGVTIDLFNPERKNAWYLIYAIK